VRREELIATPEAAAWYDHWIKHQPDPEDARETSTKRRGNHLWKLAATLAISEGHLPRIHLSDFQLAAAIFEHEWAYFRRLLGILEQPPEVDFMDYIEEVLFKAGAVEPAAMMKHELFRVLRGRKGLTPPTVKAIPLLESLDAAGRIRHLKGYSRLKGKPATGEAYQLTAEAAQDHVPKRRGAKPKLVETSTLSDDNAEPILQGAEDGLDG